MSGRIAKKIYIGILCLGLICALAGGGMLVMRAINRTQYTPTEILDDIRIDVEELPDDEDEDMVSEVNDGE